MKATSKGITLIALVMTIAVLLILAGITINFVINDNGIIRKAKEAKADSAYSEKREEVTTAISKAYVAKNGREITPEDVVNRVNSTYKENVIYAREAVEYNIAKENSYENIFPVYIIYPDNTKIYVDEENEVKDKYSINDAGKVPNNNEDEEEKTGEKPGYEDKIYDSETKVPDGYIPIYSQRELEKVGSSEELEVKGKVYNFLPDAKYIVMNNVKLEGEWIPLANEFTGLFEGNYKTISNMTITEFTVEDTDTRDNGRGIFSTSSGTIQNLKVTEINISDENTNGKRGGYATGGIVGNLVNGGKISNCSTSGKIVQYVLDSGTGGFVGEIENGIIENSTNNVQIMSLAYECIGGFAGYIRKSENIDVTINNCINNATIGNESRSKMAGGIIGGSYFNGATGTISLTNCINNGTIAAAYTAGLIYEAGKCDITVINCCNNGKVDCGGSGYSGGIVGQSTGTAIIERCFNTAEIYNRGIGAAGIIAIVDGKNSSIKGCYNIGKINSTSSSGGMVYLIGNDITITDCYNKGEIASNAYCAGIVSYVNSGKTLTITNVYNAGKIACSSQAPTADLVNGKSVMTYAYYLDTANVSFETTMYKETQSTVKTQNEMKSQEFVDLLNQHASEGIVWEKTTGYPKIK